MNNRHRDERREDKRERRKDERRRAEIGREERGSELGGLLIAAELEGFTPASISILEVYHPLLTEGFITHFELGFITRHKLGFCTLCNFELSGFTIAANLGLSPATNLDLTSTSNLGLSPKAKSHTHTNPRERTCTHHMHAPHAACCSRTNLKMKRARQRAVFLQGSVQIRSASFRKQWPVAVCFFCIFLYTAIVC